MGSLIVKCSYRMTEQYQNLIDIKHLHDIIYTGMYMQNECTVVIGKKHYSRFENKGWYILIM